MIRLRLVPGEPSSDSTPDVATHPLQHLSDFLAAFLLRQYGKSRYGDSADPVAGRRTVMVGRGGYDEHDDPKLRECEATLVAKDLGIAALPELQPIIDYVLKVDRFGQGKGVLKFGRLVELMHDVYPDEPSRVEHWTAVVIEASIDAARAGWAVEQIDLVVYPLIRQTYAEVSREFSPGVRSKLEEVLATFGPIEPSQPFGLPFCAGLLWRKFKNLQEPARTQSVTVWIADALRAELESQKMFLAAAGDYENGEDINLFVNGEEIMGVIGASANRRFHSYLFSELEDCVVVAVRRATGHIQIFRRPRAKVRIELWSVAAQLRAREQEKAGEPISTWDELISQRGPERSVARRWFFHHATQNVFNGSLTAEVEPTVLTDEEIRECIARGLDDSYLLFRREFYLERGGLVG